MFCWCIFHQYIFDGSGRRSRGRSSTGTQSIPSTSNAAKVSFWQPPSMTYGQWPVLMISPSMTHPHHHPLNDHFLWSHPSVWRHPSWEESTRRRCPWTGFLVDIFVVWLVVVSLFNSSLMFFLLFKLFFLYFVLLTHWWSPATGFSGVLASFPLSSLF